MSSRIGIIVPPANPTVEPEFRAMLPETINYYVARFPVLEGGLLTRLRGYNKALGDVAGSFRGLDLSLVLSACTGCAYASSLEADRAHLRGISEDTGVEVVSAPMALDWAFSTWGVTSLTLISPYPPALTELAADFWSEAGYDLVDVLQIPGTGLIYDLEEEDVRGTLTEVVVSGRNDQNHAFLVTGTGATSMSVIDELAISCDVNLISSNLALGWYSLDSLGGKELVEQASVRFLREVH